MGTTSLYGKLIRNTINNFLQNRAIFVTRIAQDTSVFLRRQLDVSGEWEMFWKHEYSDEFTSILLAGKFVSVIKDTGSVLSDKRQPCSCAARSEWKHVL
jgi:siroheme synthase (precorrin-2 oxidase/ferrochelatase)